MDARFTRLFLAAASRPPVGTAAVTTIRSVSLKRGKSGAVAGLTSYVPAKGGSPPFQTMRFYSLLLDELSDRDATGVMAHELAHAWLNEHSTPRASRSRELEADSLARSWGSVPNWMLLSAKQTPSTASDRSSCSVNGKGA